MQLSAVALLSVLTSLKAAPSNAYFLSNAPRQGQGRQRRHHVDSSSATNMKQNRLLPLAAAKNNDNAKDNEEDDEDDDIKKAFELVGFDAKRFENFKSTNIGGLASSSSNDNDDSTNTTSQSGSFQADLVEKSSFFPLPTQQSTTATREGYYNGSIPKQQRQPRQDEERVVDHDKFPAMASSSSLSHSSTNERNISLLDATVSTQSKTTPHLNGMDRSSTAPKAPLQPLISKIDDMPNFDLSRPAATTPTTTTRGTTAATVRGSSPTTSTTDTSRSAEPWNSDSSASTPKNSLLSKEQEHRIQADRQAKEAATKLADRSYPWQVSMRSTTKNSVPPAPASTTSLLSEQEQDRIQADRDAMEAASSNRRSYPWQVSMRPTNKVATPTFNSILSKQEQDRSQAEQDAMEAASSKRRSYPWQVAMRPTTKFATPSFNSILSKQEQERLQAEEHLRQTAQHTSSSLLLANLNSEIATKLNEVQQQSNFLQEKKLQLKSLEALKKAKQAQLHALNSIGQEEHRADDPDSELPHGWKPPAGDSSPLGFFASPVSPSSGSGTRHGRDTAEISSTSAEFKSPENTFRGPESPQSARLQDPFTAKPPEAQSVAANNKPPPGSLENTPSKLQPGPATIPNNGSNSNGPAFPSVGGPKFLTMNNKPPFGKQVDFASKQQTESGSKPKEGSDSNKPGFPGAVGPTLPSINNKSPLGKPGNVVSSLESSTANGTTAPSKLPDKDNTQLLEKPGDFGSKMQTGLDSKPNGDASNTIGRTVPSINGAQKGPVFPAIVNKPAVNKPADSTSKFPSESDSKPNDSSNTETFPSVGPITNKPPLGKQGTFGSNSETKLKENSNEKGKSVKTINSPFGGAKFPATKNTPPLGVPGNFPSTVQTGSVVKENSASTSGGTPKGLGFSAVNSKPPPGQQGDFASNVQSGAGTIPNDTLDSKGPPVAAIKGQRNGPIFPSMNNRQSLGEPGDISSTKSSNASNNVKVPASTSADPQKMAKSPGMNKPTPGKKVDFASTLQARWKSKSTGTSEPSTEKGTANESKALGNESGDPGRGPTFKNGVQQKNPFTAKPASSQKSFPAMNKSLPDGIGGFEPKVPSGSDVKSKHSPATNKNLDESTEVTRVGNVSLGLKGRGPSRSSDVQQNPFATGPKPSSANPLPGTKVNTPQSPIVGKPADSVREPPTESKAEANSGTGSVTDAMGTGPKNPIQANPQSLGPKFPAVNESAPGKTNGLAAEQPTKSKPPVNVPPIDNAQEGIKAKPTSFENAPTVPNKMADLSVNSTVQQNSIEDNSQRSGSQPAANKKKPWDFVGNLLSKQSSKASIGPGGAAETRGSTRVGLGETKGEIGVAQDSNTTEKELYQNASSLEPSRALSEKNQTRTEEEILPGERQILVAPIGGRGNIKALSKNALAKGVQVLVNWKQNADGAIVGWVYNSENFEDGTRIVTTPIDREAKPGFLVKTASGSRYLLH